jgi:hypothetical protein
MVANWVVLLVMLWYCWMEYDVVYCCGYLSVVPMWKYLLAGL